MRVVARVFIFLIALGFLLGPAIYLARDTLAPMAVSWFARIGAGVDDLGNPRFQITDLKPNGLTLENLAMADGRVTADSARATFDLVELSKGRIRTLTIRGLTVRGRLKDGEFSFGPIEIPGSTEPMPSTEVSNPGQFPLDHLILDDVRVFVMTDTDGIELSGDFDVRRNADGSLDWSGDLSAGLSSALLGGGEARFALSLDGGFGMSGDIDTRLDLRQGDARFRDLSIGSARGGIRARRPAGGQPTVRAGLSFDDLTARGSVIPRLSLDVYGQGRSGTISAVVGDPSSQAEAYTVVGDIRHDENDRARVAFSGSGALGALHDLLGPALESPLRGIVGDLAFNGEFGLRGAIDDLVRDPAKSLAQMVGNGAAKVTISSIEVAREHHALTIRGGATAIIAPGLMEIRLTDGSRVGVPRATSRTFSKSMPGIVRPWFEDGVSVEFGLDEEPLALLASFGGDLPKFSVSGDVRTKLARGGAIALGGTATTGPPSGDAGGLWSVAFKDLLLRMTGLEVGGNHLRQGELRFGGSIGPQGAVGTFSVQGDGTFGDAAPLEGTAIQLAGTLTSVGHETHISVDSAGVTLSPRGGKGDGFAVFDPVEITLASGTPTAIVISRASDDVFPRFITTAWDVGAVTVGWSDDGDSQAIKLDIGRIGATFASALGDAEGRVAMELDTARADFTGRAFGLSNLAISAGFKAEFKAGDILGGLTSLDASIAEIASITGPAWLMPLGVKMSGQRPGAAGALNLEGAVTSVTTPFEIPFTGEVHLDDGAGRVAVAETWLTFGPEALSLASVSPALSTHVETLTGRIGVSGHLAWPIGAEATTRRLTVDVEALSITGAGVSVENARGGISFSRFMPPRSDGVGALSMDMLGVGVPIPHPRLELSIDGLDGVVLHTASGGFAGGRIYTSDVQLAFDEPTTMTVHADGVDAAAISSMLKVQGLDAEGSLSGVLPVTWTPGLGVSIADARLSADGPGTVRYEAGEKDDALRKSGEQVGLMLDALSDFRFKTLEMGLAGTPGAGFHVDLALEGSNPNLYDGYPVRFNLDLVGQLDDIIKTGYRTYTLPDRVRDAVLRGEAND